MSQTRVKIKSKKLPNLDGYATSERLNHAPEGMTLPQAANGAGYVNTPIMSESAPNYALPSPLQKALKIYEQQKLLDFYDGWCVKNGRPKASNYEAGPAPSGKMSGGGLGFRQSDAYLHKWYSEINGLADETATHGLPLYKKCGLEFFCRVQAGEGGDYGLEDLGRVMARVDQLVIDVDKKIRAIIIQKMSEAGYVAFYASAVQSIYATEKCISDIRRAKRYLSAEQRLRLVR